MNNTTEIDYDGPYFRLIWRTIYWLYEIWVPKSRAVKVNL